MVRVEKSRSDKRVFDYEVLDFDAEAAPSRIQDDSDFVSWLDEHCTFKRPGIYIIYDVQADFTPAIYGLQECEVRWHFDRIRRPKARSSPARYWILSQPDRNERSCPNPDLVKTRAQ
jgi:hypothetical protein